MSSIKQMLTALVLAGTALFAQVGNAGGYYGESRYASQRYYDGDRYDRHDNSAAVGVALLVGLAALVAYDRHDHRRDQRRYERSRRHSYNYGYRDRGYRDHGRRGDGRWQGHGRRGW
jgi:hypothetical protein